jgi:hypothetical protein
LALFVFLLAFLLFREHMILLSSMARSPCRPPLSRSRHKSTWPLSPLDDPPLLVLGESIGGQWARMQGCRGGRGKPNALVPVQTRRPLPFPPPPFTPFNRAPAHFFDVFIFY